MATTSSIELCNECGKEYQSEKITMDGHVVFSQRYCIECSEAHQATMQAEENAKKNQRLAESFNLLVPPLYRESDLNRIHQTYAKQATDWLYQATGVGLVGRSGYGKTRASYAILKRFHFQGLKCEAFSACEFGKLSVDQFCDDKQIKAKAQAKITSAYAAKLLLIDDVGKARMTDRSEMEFYALIEHRTNQMLPTIWTANAKSAELLSMFSHDRGEPIIRRLKESSEIVAQWT